MTPRRTILLLFLAALLHAHVGSPDVFYEGMAGPYRLLVTIRPPIVIPGVAEIEIRAADGDVGAGRECEQHLYRRLWSKPFARICSRANQVALAGFPRRMLQIDAVAQESRSQPGSDHVAGEIEQADDDFPFIRHVVHCNLRNAEFATARLAGRDSTTELG